MATEDRLLGLEAVAFGGVWTGLYVIDPESGERLGQLPATEAAIEIAAGNRALLRTIIYQASPGGGRHSIEIHDGQPLRSGLATHHFVATLESAG